MRVDLKMPTTRVFALCALLFAAATTAQAAAQDKLPVVATFSILADFAAQVGGDKVAVTTLVGPDADAHAFSPSPAEAKRLATARVVLTNGLGFEGWLARLVKASGTKATVVVATKGIKTRALKSDGHGHGHEDPHAWQSVVNAKVYVSNIRDALAQADPANASVYAANATAYLAKLDALDADVKAAVATIPAERRKIITTHDAFGYFAAAYGVQFIAPQGVSTDADVSAKDVATIIRQIRAQKIPAVFIENVSAAGLMQRIAAESGAKVGGQLYSDALSKPDGPAATYIDMMRHNLKQLSAALMM
jgi:zinc/manganese transport system substrate-binding protein